MKNFLLLLLLLIISTTAKAQSPWYFGSGEAVNLTDAIKYKSGVRQVAGALDPTVTAVPGEAGSVYLSTSGNMYIKQDSGLSTNWNLVGAGGGGGGINSINGQSGPSVSIAVGTAGTDANVTATGNTVTVNLPTASATNRGLLSSTDWADFNSKEDAIASGTTAQYFRGDKTWQTLDKSSVGLSNVDNTSDADKPISTATQTALNNKAPSLKNYPKVLPTLNLNFARDQKLDERITFTRASERTCINEFGLIYNLEPNEPCFDHDPVTLESKGLLIEESRTNLLTHSNQFDNAVWEKLQASVIPYSSTAPDGSFTASKLIPSIQVAIHLIRPSTLNLAAEDGKEYTLSAFAKAGGYDRFRLSFENTSWVGGAQPAASLNLSTGEAYGISPAVTNHTVKYLGNGTYHFSITVKAVGNFNTRIGIWVTNPNGTSGAFAGDGSSGIYIWNAELEVGSFPTSTISSTETFTSRASTATYIDQDGLIKTAAIDEERLSYNPENLNIPPKILLEGASTNLALYSEDLSNAYWAKNKVSVSTGTASPIAGVNYSKIIPTAENDNHGVSRLFSSVPAGTHTFSFHAKDSGYDFVRLRLALNGTFAKSFIVNLKDGSISTVSGSTTMIMGVRKLSDGYRVFGTYLTESTANHDLSIWVHNTAANNPFAGDGSSGIEVTGIQVEKGSLSSYIKTEGSTATRAEDIYTSTSATRAADLASITGANFSEWYNQSEGTFVVGAYPMANYPEEANIFSVSNNTTSEYIKMSFDANNLAARMSSAYGGVTQVSSIFGTAILGKRLNASLTYKKDDWGASLDGGSVSTDTSGLVPLPDRIYLSANPLGTVTSMTLGKLLYFPKRLTNEEIQTTSDPEVNDFLWAVGQ